MDKRLSKRIEKIERELEPEKGACLRFPDGEGGFIEVPGCRTLADLAARCSVTEEDKRLTKLNESERLGAE